MLNKSLEHAYWTLKNRSVEEAIKLVHPVITVGDWARFDSVFSMISEWPNKQPAIHFIKLYLPSLLRHSNPMRALNLCEWSLKQDAEFTLQDTAGLIQLMSECGSKSQYVAAVKMLENFTVANPIHADCRKLLLLAADICQAKLNHRPKFEELQGRIDSLD
ncbi:MAG: hypothetical protein QGF90_11725 [Gammaproteobacteria bacterium]|jgi:hypothetical protein|nr:hypothetical protein [Gammaproteobacteria bacterium]